MSFTLCVPVLTIIAFSQCIAAQNSYYSSSLQGVANLYRPTISPYSVIRIPPNKREGSNLDSEHGQAHDGGGYGYGGYEPHHHQPHEHGHEETKLGKWGVTKILLAIFPFVVTVVFVATLMIFLGLALIPVLAGNEGRLAGRRSVTYDQIQRIAESLSKYN